jgi:hypothetical protein
MQQITRFNYILSPKTAVKKHICVWHCSSFRLRVYRAITGSGNSVEQFINGSIYLSVCGGGGGGSKSGLI